MKLYQGLTQVTVNDAMIDDAPNFDITTELVAPLHFTPSELYHYIDSVLQPGSRHDENNLRYVTDAPFIAENHDFKAFTTTIDVTTFEGKMQVARALVDDLNRHVSINVDTADHHFAIIFVD